MNLNVNDILYTKDGRKSGNLVIVSKELVKVEDLRPIYQLMLARDNPDITEYYRYQAISDYGNLITVTSLSLAISKQFFKTTGKATESHKHYNYMENHPEDFI